MSEEGAGSGGGASVGLTTGVTRAPPPRGFPLAEFEGRLERAQRAMAHDEVDLLLLTGEADIRWFSGFLTPFWQSPTRPWFLLVPRSGPPVAVIPSIGADCMARTWVHDIRTWPSPRPADDGVGLLGETIRELAGSQARVGLPMGAGTHLRMPLADFERLKGSLPGAAWQDVTALLVGLRAIKSAAEIDKIRHVCHAASRAFDALPELVVPGMSDVDVFRAFRTRCLSEGADEVSFLVGSAAPGGYGDIISPPSGRPLAAGDVLILDTGCTFDGYFCDFDRNHAVGEPGAAAAEAYRVAWRATEAGLAAARPGATCHELFDAMAAVMAPHVEASAGIGRSGHGLGMQLTEPPSLMPGDATELRPNMVITLEPGFSFAPGKVMVHEENVLITEDGCELLSVRASPELPRHPVALMRILDADYDPASGDGPAVGLIVLQSDEVMEGELRAWLPSGLRLLHTRIPSGTEVSADALREMERELPGAARLLPAGVRFDVVAYGCTSASTLIGEARVAALVRSVVPGAAVTNPLTAVKARLASLGVTRIALLTPYVPALSRAIVEHLEGAGIEVRQAATFDERDDARVARIAPRATLEALLALGAHDDCDAVFGSCTNLRALGLLEEAERRLGKPVMTSNSALAWHIGRLLDGE